MPSILVTTIGGSTSNSYNTADEFDTFLGLKRNSATVLALDDEPKELALLEAMDLLEELNWNGYRVTTTQALSHPRYELPKKDSVQSAAYVDSYGGSYGVEYPQFYLSTEIAAPVKKAQCELAFALLNESYSTTDTDAAQVQSVTADGVSVSFGSGSASQSRAQKGQLPQAVARLLSGLVRGSRLLRA